MVIGWLISICMFSIAVYLPYHSDHVKAWPVWAAIIMTSVQRLLVAGPISWMIFACVTGYGG